MGYFDPKPQTNEPVEAHALLWRVFQIALVIVIIALLVALIVPIWVRRGVD